MVCIVICHRPAGAQLTGGWNVPAHSHDTTRVRPLQQLRKSDVDDALHWRIHRGRRMGVKVKDEGCRTALRM